MFLSEFAAAGCKGMGEMRPNGASSKASRAMTRPLWTDGLT